MDGMSPTGLSTPPGTPGASNPQMQARQKMMSDMLRAGATTAPQGQMVGNQYVAPNPLQSLGQLANAAGYAYMNRG